MRKITSFIVVALIAFSCSADVETYDDTGLKDSISNLEERVTKLETLCNQMNSNINAIQAIVTALQGKEYIESIKQLPDNQGYAFSFSSGRFVTIYNGKDGNDGENGRDGKDGVTPAIGVKQDGDGVWYWTLNGDWLYADGKKVKAIGTDGKDGVDGKDGESGSDGQDGVTPKLKIEDGMWYMSCDDGASWAQLGKATGDDGADAGIISVTEDRGYVHFEMSDSTVITIAKRMPLTISFDSEDAAITTGGASKTIGYTLTGASDKVVVKTFVQDGWKAKVNQESTASGTIQITAPDPLIESEVLVFVSDVGQTALAAINCVKATIIISQEKYEVEASGGNIDVMAQTNTDFNVLIPDDAKWLSYTPTKSMETKTFSLSVVANDNALRRNTVVSLTDDSGNVIRSFIVSQAGDMSGLVSIQCDVKGDLHSILEAYDKENIVKMKISGVLNDVDFLDIYYEMPALRYLDISEVDIEALPKDSFKKSTNVTTIVLPKTLATIPESCFEESKVSGKLVIPASCETIGTSAFKNCGSLESVVFEHGSQLKSFPDCAFIYCTALTSIMIPASCEEIGNSAFQNCSSLESVVFESGSRLNIIRTAAYNGCVALKSIIIPASCEIIGLSAFRDCSSLKGVVFEQESQLKNILGSYSKYESSGEYYYSSCGAFSNCTALESIIIPASCEDIGDTAFKNCRSLWRVVFEPSSRLKIISGDAVYDHSSIYSRSYSYSAGAFSDCTALRSIIIPASCETIGNSAFSDCSSLESVVFESGSQLKAIKGSSFSTETSSYYAGTFSCCVALKSIIIPASCEIIEKAAFKYCRSLESVAFEPGSRLKTIAGGSDPYYPSSYDSPYYFGAFSDCTALKSIIIPASCESIEAYAFRNCCSLTDLSFESTSGIQTIGVSAFRDCGLLHRIDMQHCTKLKEIGSKALYGNDQIYFLQIGAATPPTLGFNVFGSVGVYSVLKVPAGSESAYEKASGWREFSSITAID